MAKRIIVTVLIACLVCGAVFAQQKAKDFAAQGQEHMKNGNYAEAVAAFESAVKLEPKNKTYEKNLNEAKQKRTEEAYAQAQKLHQEGNYKEAIALYSAAINYAPAGYKTTNISGRRTEAQKALAFAEQQALQQEQKTLEEQEKARIEKEQAAKAQAEKERADQIRQGVQKGNELFIAGNYADAIAQYEQAVTSGVLTDVEKKETERLITEARDVQNKLVSYNRPLNDKDFEVAQVGNIITITKYKAFETKTISIAGVSHTLHFGILNIDFPQRIGGQPLSIIGNEAFKGCGLKSVVIPDTVTEIGWGAFANNNLEKVTLGKGLKIIKGGASQGIVEVYELGAFEGNKNLAEVIIPDAVTEIGARAFKDCGLKRVVFGKMVQTIGESAFRNNQLPAIEFQPAVRYIRRFAFHQNQIKNLLLPNGILEIYDEAFTNNPMESISIPASLATTTKINGFDCPRIGGYFAKYAASSPLTFPNTLILVTLPANLHDDNLTTFEANLRTYYTGNKKALGVYLKDRDTGVWSYKR
jgi:tetratricopeptide (TPR) repeat protein